MSPQKNLLFGTQQWTATFPRGGFQSEALKACTPNTGEIPPSRVEAASAANFFLWCSKLVTSKKSFSFNIEITLNIMQQELMQLLVRIKYLFRCRGVTFITCPCSHEVVLRKVKIYSKQTFPHPLHSLIISGKRELQSTEVCSLNYCSLIQTGSQSRSPCSTPNPVSNLELI